MDIKVGKIFGRGVYVADERGQKAIDMILSRKAKIMIEEIELSSKLRPEAGRDEGVKLTITAEVGTKRSRAPIGFMDSSKGASDEG